MKFNLRAYFQNFALLFLILFLMTKCEFTHGQLILGALAFSFLINLLNPVLLESKDEPKV